MVLAAASWLTILVAAAFDPMPAYGNSLSVPHRPRTSHIYAALVVGGYPTTTANASNGVRTRKAAGGEIAALQSWLNDFAANSDTVVGIAAFVAAGDTVSQVVAGDATVPKAFDRTTKKNVVSDRQPVKESSRFMLASTSKTVVWTALTMMLDAGKFQLDDAVDDSLPFKLRNPRFPADPVTYRHVYTHTTGMKDDYVYKYSSDCSSDPMIPYPVPLGDSLAGPLTQSRSNWYSWKPGSKYEYSNMATAVAGLLVEKHSRMSFPQFTQKYIFDALQMTSTSWSRPNDGTATEQYTLGNINSKWPYKVRLGGYCFVDYPSGQLWSTAGDMAKFSQSMLGYGNIPSKSTADTGGGCLYSRDTGERAFQPQSPTTGDGDSALGWFAGDPVYTGGVGHDGSEEGVSADLFVHLDQNTAIGWMANGELKDREFAALTKKLDATAKEIRDNGQFAVADSPWWVNPSSAGCKRVWQESGSPTEAPTPRPTPKPSVKTCATFEDRCRPSKRWELVDNAATVECKNNKCRKRQCCKKRVRQKYCSVFSCRRRFEHVANAATLKCGSRGDPKCRKNVCCQRS